MKLGEADGYDLEDPVAPRRGAWIETCAPVCNG